MGKRKQAESSSDCSQVYNPESPHNFTPNSSIECVENPNFKKQKTSLTMESKLSSFIPNSPIQCVQNPNFKNQKSKPSPNDLGAGFLVQFFDAQLNGAPFFDFFAQENIEGFIIQPKKPTLDSPVSYSDGGGPSTSDESDECSENLIEAVPLRVYRPESSIDWTVRKVLTVSDCNAQHRLLIRKAVVEERILPHLEDSSRALINSLNGLRVNVFDVDMGVELKLTLKKWPSSQYYGLMNNWRRDFVNRRGLVPGDEVGICWDKSNNRFLLSVLCKLTLHAT